MCCDNEEPVETIETVENIENDPSFEHTQSNTESSVESPVESADEPADEPAPEVAPAEDALKPKTKDPLKWMWLKVAILCIICFVAGGLVLFGILKLSGAFTAKESSGESVQIVVDSVTSPATAVAKKVLPSIVGIKVTYVTEVSSWFFGTTQSQGTAEGSGIIYSSDGYILTNYHVISEATTNAGELRQNSSVEVYFYNDDSGKGVSATIVGYNISSDLAVIKVDKTGLTPIEVGNSDEVAEGDIAIALGNPGGLQFMGSVSQGIISGLNRTISVEGNTYKDVALIQTDCAINPGNSGGALVDVSGKLIGINSVKLVESGFEGMGFAIPSNYAATLADEIITNGKNYNYVYLGIEEDTRYTAETLEKNGYPGGVVVKSVATGSPAEKAGIEVLDIIVSFNGKEVRTMAQLNEEKLKCSPGDTVKVRIFRAGKLSGKYYEYDVTLA